MSKAMLEKLKRFDYTPKPWNQDVTKEQLKELLMTPKKFKLFHFKHDWVYWTYGPATRWHRVCKKCFKKQEANSVLGSKSSGWIKEPYSK